jgi:opacity protein-like surface antigen
MRKSYGRLLVALLVFSFSGMLHAEETTASRVGEEVVKTSEVSKFRIGIELGLDSSTVVCDSCDSIGMAPRIGLATGATAEYLFSDHLALEVEAMYLQKGVNIKPGSTTTAKINYETIDFPVSLKGRFGNQKVKGTVFAGPQFGLAVTKSLTVIGSGTSSLSARGFDFGIHVGGGVEFQVTETMNIFLNGRFNFGLVDLDIQKYLPAGDSAHSLGLLLMSGIKFGL